MAGSGKKELFVNQVNFTNFEERVNNLSACFKTVEEPPQDRDLDMGTAKRIWGAFATVQKDAAKLIEDLKNIYCESISNSRQKEAAEKAKKLWARVVTLLGLYDENAQRVYKLASLNCNSSGKALVLDALEKDFVETIKRCERNILVARFSF